MEDVVGRVFAPIFLIIAITLIPLVFVFSGLDLTQRSYVQETVDNYASEIRSTGVISKANYEKFIMDLQKTGMIFDINVVHKSKTVVPYGDGDYRTAFRSYGKDDILSYIEGYGDDMIPNTADDNEGYDYVMKNGDFITIKITSVEGTPGTKYLGLLNGSGSRGIKLSASSGGMVGNTR